MTSTTDAVVSHVIRRSRDGSDAQGSQRGQWHRRRDGRAPDFLTAHGR